MCTETYVCAYMQTRDACVYAHDVHLETHMCVCGYIRMIVCMRTYMYLSFFSVTHWSCALIHAYIHTYICMDSDACKAL